MLRSGIDLIDVARFRRLEGGVRQRFIDRIYTEAEQAYCSDENQHLAGRFAAKEAVSKALGTGLGMIHWRDIEILDNDLGLPQLTLYGKAKERSDALGLKEWSVSITHLKEYAAAVAVATGEKGS